MARFRRTNAAEGAPQRTGALAHLKVVLIAAAIGLAAYGVVKLLVYVSQDLLGNPL